MSGSLSIGAFHCFWRGGVIADLTGGLLGGWSGASGLFWGFPLAAGRQEEEGCWLPVGTRSPVVGPFRRFSYIKGGDHGGWFRSLLGEGLV